MFWLDDDEVAEVPERSKQVMHYTDLQASVAGGGRGSKCSMQLQCDSDMTVTVMWSSVT